MILGEIKKGKNNHNFGKHTWNFGTPMSEEQKALIKGDKNPNYKGGPIKRNCPECGKEFEVPLCEIKRGHGKYCSRLCATKAYKGKKHTDESKALMSVSAIKRMHNSPLDMTAPEKRFESICEKHNLPFACNVNAKQNIGNAIPDFIHISKKIIVEVFGNHWHSIWSGFKGLTYNKTFEGRIEQLKKEGYKCIVIWESDLMREDSEKYVMHLMNKEGLI
jgi:G:T-mismatch repair DNA endonuclease (very short patch repair protein)